MNICVALGRCQVLGRALIHKDLCMCAMGNVTSVKGVRLLSAIILGMQIFKCQTNKRGKTSFVISGKHLPMTSWSFSRSSFSAGCLSSWD